MRKSRVLVCCVLIFIALELMTSIDAQKAMEKKNRKQQKKDLTKDKSTKEDSREEEMDDVNPKLKPFQNKQTKKPRERKIQNDFTEIPNLQPDVTDVKADQPQSKQLDIKPEKKIQNDSTEIPILKPDFTEGKLLQHRPLDIKPVFQTTLSEPPPPQKCSPTVGNSGKLLEIERNVTSLWRHLSFVSQPIHVHVHSGRDSSPGYHRNHGSEGRCHGDRSRRGHHRSHKDNVAETQDYHGHHHNHSHDHSHHHHSNHSFRPNPGTQDSDKPHPHNTTSSPKCGCRGRHNRSHNETELADHSHKSHHHSKHHSKNHTHTHHVQRPGDRSHKSHHHSKHHSKNHTHTHHVQRPGDRSHKCHHHPKHHSKSHSHTHHAHRLEDHSHKSRHHSKHHSHGYKSTKGHDYNRSKGHHHRGGHGFGDRSTHIHIHLTLDEKPSPVHREINKSEPTAATPAPEVSHEHTDPHTPDPVFGRCDFLNNGINNNLVGYVLLRQSSSGVDVAVSISGFDLPASESDQPGRRLHGFHVHESGDFSKGCLSFGGHFNPEGTTHGGLTHDIRSADWHVGDWGNIEANAQGRAVTHFSVQDATLQGPHSILGRGIVVHEHEDDLGEGGVPASKTTGNAGGRLACCIIGHSKPLPEEAFQRRNDTLSNTAPDLGQISGS